MARVKRGVTKQNRHKKVLKQAKGSRGRSKNTFRAAIQRVEKDLQYAYRDRRQRKRQFRALWVVRINAAARLFGLSYSQFIHGMKLANVEVDRKMLAELAVNNITAFEVVAEKAKLALAQ